MENFENICLPWRDWKIVKDLGGGAYGRVYEIERTISGIQEKAALKIVSRPKNKDEMESYYNEGYSKADLIASYESEIQNYVQEYKLMKELQGESNIVSCDDFTMVPHEDGIGGDIFIRMELLTSLQQILRERSLSEQEIIKLGKDISHALVLCESKNIIHRDIKPANIMVSQFGNYKLGDFGVSKIMDHATFATSMGTPEYQAPEVVHMERYGQAVDIYSLGITLYWLLNNRRMPFIDANQQITLAVKNEAMDRRYRGEKLPVPKNGSAKLKQVVLKACAYRPEDRYASAKELYEALDALKPGKASENNSRQNNRDTSDKGKDLHKSILVSENEMGEHKTVRIQYPNGQEKTFDVKIPADIRSGQSLRLSGQGIAEAGGTAGDLFLDITVTEQGGVSDDNWNDSRATQGNSWDDATNATIGKPKSKKVSGASAGTSDTVSRQAQATVDKTMGKTEAYQKQEKQKKQKKQTAREFMEEEKKNDTKFFILVYGVTSVLLLFFAFMVNIGDVTRLSSAARNAYQEFIYRKGLYEVGMSVFGWIGLVLAIAFVKTWKASKSIRIIGPILQIHAILTPIIIFSEEFYLRKIGKAPDEFDMFEVICVAIVIYFFGRVVYLIRKLLKAE